MKNLRRKIIGWILLLSLGLNMWLLLLIPIPLYLLLSEPFKENEPIADGQ